MILWDLEWHDPFGAFAPLAGEAHAHLLHGGDQARSAEWSIITAFPSSMIIADEESADPFRALDDALRDRRSSAESGTRGLPFVSGAVGFAGYEAARYFEACLDLPRSPFSFPDAVFGLYDAAALFSRSKRQAFIAGRDEAACRRLRGALGANSRPSSRGETFGPLTSNFMPQQYCAAVSDVIENILDGEYYQVNLSHQLRSKALSAINAFHLFQRLAAGSDAQHGALLQYEQGAIVSNSPERFFRIERGAYGARRIISEPIKGTRPRGENQEEDAALARSLAADPKDRAENIMIADLVRNDLSSICVDGTIREESICELMSLTNVHHLVSRISGVLRANESPSSIFSALFPCGSITGAPKIAAMNAIAKMEAVGRGPYCGAIGYFDDSGVADFSVSIRTLIVENDIIALPVGGGVTLRSDPENEYEETIAKARGARAAMGEPALEARRR
ncbi:anthranilate synthase component I family protein [Hyphococcus sp.]|uniref:anthranilate synthase component I family protein n=1 Tax=Hyphococcus sp. TaxID=2038636 RepID=UPI002083EE84|nr:MAG: aminodeoxychorismate synthase component I [Marinicaulis sp.]